MTKARKGIMWSLIAVLAALLVALAVVGVTFARYSSSGSGSGSASVAQWDVSVVDAASGEGTVMADAFSPEASEYDGETVRHNESGRILVATIQNGGKVDAEVTVSGGTTLTYTFYDDNCANGCVANGVYSSSTCSDYAAVAGAEGYCDFCYGYQTLGYGSELSSHFTVALYQNSEADNAANATTLGTAETVEAGGSMYIYAEITWTSDAGTVTGSAADAFDTWCGHYLKSISFDLTYEAVQVSDL